MEHPEGKVKVMKWFLLTIICLMILFLSYQFKLVAMTYNMVRPLLLEDNGKTCLHHLTTKNIGYRHLGLLQEGNCLIKNAVRIENFPETKLSSPITVSCSTAKALHQYFIEIKAQTITHLGSYNCRKIRNSSMISEHSYGTALDISAINGASIEKNWNKDSTEGELLHKAYQSACALFSNVLTPDSDKNHHNHIHLDKGIGLGC